MTSSRSVPSRRGKWGRRGTTDVGLERSSVDLGGYGALRSKRWRSPSPVPKGGREQLDRAVGQRRSGRVHEDHT